MKAAAHAAAARSRAASESPSARRTPIEASHGSARVIPAMAAAALTQPSSSSVAASSCSTGIRSGGAICKASRFTTESLDSSSSGSIAANVSGEVFASAAAANSLVLASAPRMKPWSSPIWSGVGRPTAC